MRRHYKEKKKVLLVNITRLGDMIQATPTIAGIRAENPDVHIAVLVEHAFSQVCSIIPGIDEIIPIDLSLLVRCLSQEGEGIIDAFHYLSEVIEHLQSSEFDYCLNMSNSAYTALLLRLINVERIGGWISDAEGYRRIESDWARLFAANIFFRNRHLNTLNLVDIFRASADVEEHPQTLLLQVPDDATEWADRFIKENFEHSSGPLIALQAGASQDKRQWNPRNFTRLIKILRETLHARIIMTGTKKELPIIEAALEGINPEGIVISAGRTDIPQLSALLKQCDCMVTGDTGPMHMAVAVGTPVVAMFLASALCHETGPYREGCIVAQPVIECGPCNPNKLCSRPECHDLVSPELIAELVTRRLESDTFSLSSTDINCDEVIVYRSEFDEFGYLEFVPIHPIRISLDVTFREAYRRLWIDDLGIGEYSTRPTLQGFYRSFSIAEKDSEIIEDTIKRVQFLASEGVKTVEALASAVKDISVPARVLGDINQRLGEIDREIEEIGFSASYLSPLSRMFVFARENLTGSDPLRLASQMKDHYEDLHRRCIKLIRYVKEVSNSIQRVSTEQKRSKESKNHTTYNLGNH